MERAGEARFVLYAHAIIFAVRSDHRGALLWTCFGLWHRNHAHCRLDNNGDRGPWWLRDLLVEDEMARVTVELGVIGLLLNYFLRFLIAAFALRWGISFKDPAYRALGIVLAVHLALGIAFPIIFNSTAAPLLLGRPRPRAHYAPVGAVRRDEECKSPYGHSSKDCPFNCWLEQNPMRWL